MKVLLGPVGELREVPCLPVVSVDTERASRSMTLLDGSRHVQVARRRHKSWSWDVQLSTSADLAWLAELASGGVVGPYWLYTSKAARENLAPPQLQVAGSGVVSGRRVLAAGDPQIGTSRQVPVLPNRVYHLSALGDGAGSVTVTSDDPTPITNLATNGSFETSGATVEVRRNLIPRPRPSSGPWSVNGGAKRVAVSYEDGWVVATPNVPGEQSPDAYLDLSAAASNATLEPNTTYTLQARIRVYEGSSASNGIQTNSIWVYVSGELRGYAQPPGINVPGEYDLAVTFTTPETLEGATFFRLYTGRSAPAAWTRICLEKTSGVLPFFDGSYSPDPDLTPEWTEMVNSSASVLRAPAVSTVTSTRTNAFSVQSSRWAESGSKSLRIIPRTNSAESAAMVFGSAAGLGGFAVGKTYTAAAYVRLEAPQTGNLYPYVRSMRLTTNTVAGWKGASYQTSNTAPNEAGVHLVRCTFTIPTDAVWALLEFYNGATLGGGDVWWDDFTIVEGEHPDLMPFGQASSASAVLTPASGKRASVTILSGDATHVTLTTTAGVGQLRLTEGPHEGFMPGDGVAPVMVQDPQETLQRVIDGDHRSDFGVTIQEVG